MNTYVRGIFGLGLIALLAAAVYLLSGRHFDAFVFILLGVTNLLMSIERDKCE